MKPVRYSTLHLGQNMKDVGVYTPNIAKVRVCRLTGKVDHSTPQQPRLAVIIGRETPPLFLIADIRLLITLAVALAEGFEEDYAGGYAYVEGFHRAGGGQRHHEVAAFARQIVQALTFAAEHDAYR